MTSSELRDEIICDALDALSREAYRLPDQPKQEVLDLLDRVAILLGLVTAEDLQMP